jgi:hypothetical protein
MKIIILTTTITRPDIHTKIFNNIHYFLDNLDIKWLINIDKYYDSINETKNNLQNLLSKYDIEFFISEKGNFFDATRKLYLAAEKYLIDDTLILWLEDDWLVKDNIKLIDLFNQLNYLNFNNIHLSLAFNEVGTLPPHIFGSNIVKYIIKKFKKCKTYSNPESFMSLIMKEYINKYKCKYILLNYPNDNKNLIKSLYFNECDNRKYYLITNNYSYDNLKNLVKKYKFKKNINKKLMNTYIINSLYEFNQNNELISIKFGSIYDKRIFEDIGIQWKKDNYIQHTHLHH